jgi:hypothetical protein
MSYVTPRGCWCNITILNVHASTEEKTDDMKDNLNEEIEHVFDKFSKPNEKFC